MTKKEAREAVAIEMDYWRELLFRKIKEKEGRTRSLLDHEVIICSMLAVATSLLQRSPY